MKTLSPQPFPYKPGMAVVIVNCDGKSKPFEGTLEDLRVVSHGRELFYTPKSGDKYFITPKAKAPPCVSPSPPMTNSRSCILAPIAPIG